jgi:hypothetical protein
MARIGPQCHRKNKYNLSSIFSSYSKRNKIDPLTIHAYVCHAFCNSTGILYMLTCVMLFVTIQEYCTKKLKINQIVIIIIIVI